MGKSAPGRSERKGISLVDAVNKPMPERIEASPEEIAEIVLKFRPPPPGEWKYQKKDKKK